MNATFDALAAVGTELTDDQLDDTTGAAILVMFFCGFVIGFTGAMLVDLATS